MSAKRLDRASARGRRRSPGAVGPPRDFKGYGRNPPDPRWPGGARIAVNINLNFEAGGEHCLLEGDDRSEDALNDIGLPAYHGVRSPVVKSVFEYGPRSGCWRLLRIFKRFGIKISILGVVRALELSPELTRAFMADGHEILSHGYRWLDYNDIDEKTEREHIRLGVETIRRLDRRGAGRLVQRPPQHQHAAPAGRTRRLSLRPRLSRRRAALLDPFRQATPPGHPDAHSRPTTTASTAIWVSAPPTASPAT